MKAAVIGAGLFGCMAAIELARAGAQVDLYERHPDLLHGGSGNSCGRLHRGYHYPRSESTALASKAAADEFTRAYPSAVHRSAKHHYLIAPDSLVSGPDYLTFLDSLQLPYRQYGHPSVDVAVEVPESLINVAKLRAALHRQLAAAPVRLLLGCEGGPDMPGYDLTVLATYGAHTARPLQFEVTEVAVCQLGPEYAGQSYVVLDGPYCCIDPLPGTRHHLLYDVVHSVHHRTVGMRPQVPEHLRELMDAGPVRTPRTRFNRMADTARRFLGDFPATYVASMFTIRAVLPDVAATDERPTLVERDGDTVRILSGKIGTALAAAREITAAMVDA